MLQLCRYFSNLRKIKLIKNILQIEPRAIKTYFDVVILDYDGVLAAHASPVVHPKVKAWLQQLLQVFPPERVYILSNKPTWQRAEYIEKTFTGLNFISGVAKKPYPAGILQILQQNDNVAERVLIVDDRLLTGCLAGVIAGVQPWLIMQPWVDFTKRPVRESFFLSLRFIERIILGVSLNGIRGNRELY